MNTILLSGMMGGLGGMARACIGLRKAMTVKKKVVWSYWFVTIGIAVVIGVAAGIMLNTDPKWSILAGYAGTDVLEGFYKMFRKQLSGTS